MNFIILMIKITDIEYKYIKIIQLYIFLIIQIYIIQLLENR